VAVSREKGEFELVKTTSTAISLRRSVDVSRKLKPGKSSITWKVS